MNRQILIILVLILILWMICQHNVISKDDHQVVLSIFQADGTLVKKSSSVGESILGSNVTKELDYASGAPIDLNNNHVMSVFVGGENDDALLMPQGNRWIDIINQTNLNDPTARTYAAVSVDVDHNGYTDLIIARSNGVKLYVNQGRGHFIVRELLQGSNKTIPIGLAVTDYNKDGHPDIYVSQYTHPSLVRHGHPDSENYQEGLGSKVGDTGRVSDVLLEGLGTGMFEDVTHMVNLGKGGEVTTRRGNLGHRSSAALRGGPGGGGRKNAMFVDLNRDQLPDLVLTQDTGEVQIYQNTRGSSGAPYAAGPRFKKIQMPTGLGYWSSVNAVTQPDGQVNLELSKPIDGRQIGGGGSGQLQTNMVVLRNKGGMKFDPLVGKTFESDLKSAFELLMETVGLGGSIQENYDDGSWMNVAGPYRMAREKNHNWIGVRLPDSTPFLNATIYVESFNDKTGQLRKQSKQSINSSGMGLDQSKIVYFDLGTDNRVVHLAVNSIYDGSRWVHPNPKINMIATFRSMKSNPYTAN